MGATVNNYSKIRLQESNLKDTLDKYKLKKKKTIYEIVNYTILVDL